MVLLLREADVQRVLTMEMALEAVEKGLRALEFNEATNQPRLRVQTDHCMLHNMSAGIKGLGVMGSKVYATSKKHPSRFLVPLFDGKTAALLALIQADHLGQVRTGAASGVATRLLARADADEVGLFGSGKQARTQIEAVCKVRTIRRVSVYSPNEERRTRFAQEMTTSLGVPVEPVGRPELAAEGKSIVITATNSRDPVLKGEWLSPGCHLNVIGSNFLAKAEIDVEVLRRTQRIVIDNRDQGRLEAGDFSQALEEKVFQWADVLELGQVLTGRQPGRTAPEQITLFKSLGLAIEDIAVAARVYQAAREQKVGTEIDW